MTDFTDIEKNKIKHFVSFYSNMREELTSISTALTGLEARRNTALNSIEKKREEENDFLLGLKKKYGEDSIDPIKLAQIAYEGTKTR
jgi:hypothetical protein